MNAPRLVASLIVFITISCAPPEAVSGRQVEVDIEKTLALLLEEEDTDNDNRITIDDVPIAHTTRGDRRFELVGIDDRTYEINGTYYLANLLQEITLQREAGKQRAEISAGRIFENPVQRISRMIREYYWDGLTRRIDAQHLPKILQDSKVSTAGQKYVYVPHDDEFAFEYFTDVSRELPNIDVKVVRLPERVSAQELKGLEGRHGLLSLALERTPSGIVKGVPFVVPGGRFNEMYGWDSYFEALGLVVDGKVELAKAMVDNLVYEIEHYGKILNANRSYYLTRSQPPFLTSMALAVFDSLPRTQESQAWLRKVLSAAIDEYNNVWMDEHHLTETGLSRYYGTGVGVPPEVEPGHFDPIFKPYANKHGLSLDEFKERYKRGQIEEPELDAFFVHDRAMRESGHDTTYRWRIGGKDRCADFVTVDLNSLLYKYELDIGFMIRHVFDDSFPGEESDVWYARAEKRKKLILAYLWNPGKHMFFDYHVPTRRQSDYICATTFYPLWAWHPGEPETAILGNGQVEEVVYQALAYLESNGGILSSARTSLESHGIEGLARQWDYPNGWAPHQMLVWRALHNYGYTAIADRLIYKWLYTITRNAVDYNGTIPEKFDVVERSHAVFAEYGNVGTKFSYMTREGFGWMNASYQVGLGMLSEKWRESLERLVPPEWIEFE